MKNTEPSSAQQPLSPPEPGAPLSPRRRFVSKRPQTAAEEDPTRRKRMRQEPVPELFPVIGEEVSEETIETLIDLWASPSSEQLLDSRAPEPTRVHSKTGSCQALRRREEVSVRNLTCSDRDAFTAAKQKEWASWLDKEAMELVRNPLKVP